VKLLNRRIILEKEMKICSICKKISATEEDHLDCKEKQRIELEDQERKQKIPEKLDILKNPDDLSVDIRAVLEHLTKEKQKNS
jgi:hypothetical protein